MSGTYFLTLNLFVEFGLLSSPEIGFRDQWEALLREKGLTIHDHRLLSVTERGYVHTSS